MKTGKRILAGVMSFLLFAGVVLPLQALEVSPYSIRWPALSASTGQYRYNWGKFVTSDGKEYQNQSGGLGYNVISFPEGTTDFRVTPEVFYKSGSSAATLEFAPKGQTLDLSEPVAVEIYAGDGRHYPSMLVGQADRKFTEQDKEDRIALAGRLAEEGRRWYGKMEEIQQIVKKDAVEVGGYHPVYFPMLYEIGRELWQCAGVYPDTVRGGSAQATEENYRRDIIKDLKESSVAKKDDEVRADTLTKLLDVMVPYYLDYVEQHRIASPDILSYSIGDSRGVVDTEHKTVTIRMPEDTDWNDTEAPAIGVPEGVKAALRMGSPASGEAVYVLTPWEETAGVTYDGVDQEIECGYGCGVNLSRQWTVTVETGDPYTVLSSFGAVMKDGTVRYAAIDEETHTVALNLPLGTERTDLEIRAVHTGQKLLLDGQEWDGGSGDFTEARTLTVANDAFGLRQDYTVRVTAEQSAENRMLSYRIGDREGVIKGDQVSVTVPYTTGPEAEAVIEVSEFARISARPERLEFGVPMTYTVQAENGAERNYTVTVTKEAANTRAEMKSFRYGGLAGTIDEVNGTVTLEVPENTDITRLAPVIGLSPYATVVPASGEPQDFTDPVTYTVTSQSQTAQKRYTVTVRKVAAGENPYRDQMSTLVDRIVSRYRTENNAQSDDWTWMDIGLYENVLRSTPGELPEGFDLGAKIGQIDTQASTAMTTIARVNMTLTALGINTTKLDDYSDGEGFADAKGNVVHDLAACIYNYSGSYTINGPVFALIALDMGNYTVPSDAVWTREKLIEELLAHEYGTDGFDIDMVAAIMYALAPYGEDGVYGAQVKAKLEEGLAVILGEQAAPGVVPMREDKTFYAMGACNSESAGWVIAALCSFGIDPHTDARFVDGKGHTVLSQYMTFADADSFAHTATVRNNAMATYQACYVMQWYLSFLDQGGAGHPRYFYYHRFDFSRGLSSGAEITGFVLDGQKGEIDRENRTILVKVPAGMDLTDVTPELTLSEGASLKAPSLPVTFVEGVPQPFTVVAEDGKTMNSYEVTVRPDESLKGAGTELKLSSIVLQNASVLRDVEILGRTLTHRSDASEIVLKVGAETDLTDLYMKAQLSMGASADPAVLDGKTKLDLSGWNQITVTSEDKSRSQIYRIRAEKRAVAGIAAFYLPIGGRTWEGEIDDEAHTIRISGVPAETDVRALVPEILLTEGTKVCSPLSGVAQDFTVPVTYTVSGDSEEMDSCTYTVHVTDPEGKYLTGNGDNPGGNDPGGNPGNVSAEAKILSFLLYGVEGEIDEAAGTIRITLPEGTDVSAAAPKITVSGGCTVSQVVDLRSPVTYTVTNGTVSSDYTVIVVFEKSVSQQLWEKLDRMMEENGGIADSQVVKD